MTAYPLVLADSATMLRRNLRRMRRYPSLTLFIAGIPVVFLLLFVFVFGGTLGAGLGTASPGGRAAYLAYVLPGILLITVAGAAQGTAISVAMDMTEGIIARFRTMAIARASVLTGHVIGSVIQTMLAIAIVMVVAVADRIPPDDGPARLARGDRACSSSTALAISWLSVALGMAAKSVETASNLPMFLILLPFLSSGFVPTDSMPDGAQLVRREPAVHADDRDDAGLLLGTPIGNNGVLAVAWCVVISIVGYLWARRLYDRDQLRKRRGGRVGRSDRRSRVGLSRSEEARPIVVAPSAAPGPVGELLSPTTTRADDHVSDHARFPDPRRAPNPAGLRRVCDRRADRL